MPSLYDLLPEDVSLWWQSLDARSQHEKKAESVSSTDDESVDNDEQPPKITIDHVLDHRGDLSAIEMSFEEDPKEYVALRELEQDGRLGGKQKQGPHKDTKSKRALPMRLFRIPKGGMPRKKMSRKKKDLKEEDSSGFCSLEESSTDQSSTFEPASPLRALAAEQQEAVENEMDQLISEALFGFDNKVIEKELDDQHSAVSIADYVVEDVVQVGEGLLAALVDRLDMFGPFGVCATRCGTRYKHADDNVPLELESIQSRHAGGEKKGMEELVNKYITTARELVLNDDDTVTILSNGDDETIGTSDDRSLVSERNDFSKAFRLLKRHAARRGLSDLHLLDKIQAEQERRKSQGLTPTMVEI